MSPSERELILRNPLPCKSRAPGPRGGDGARLPSLKKCFPNGRWVTLAHLNQRDYGDYSHAANRILRHQSGPDLREDASLDFYDWQEAMDKDTQLYAYRQYHSSDLIEILIKGANKPRFQLFFLCPYGQPCSERRCSATSGTGPSMTPGLRSSCLPWLRFEPGTVTHRGVCTLLQKTAGTS